MTYRNKQWLNYWISKVEQQPWRLQKIYFKLESLPRDPELIQYVTMLLDLEDKLMASIPGFVNLIVNQPPKRKRRNNKLLSTLNVLKELFNYGNSGIVIDPTTFIFDCQRALNLLFNRLQTIKKFHEGL